MGFFAKLPGEAHGSVDTEIMLMILSVVLALFGWFWARRMYSGSLEAARRLSASWLTLYDLSLNKWYVDEIYQALIDFIHIPFIQGKIIQREPACTEPSCRFQASTVHPPRPEPTEEGKDDRK